MCVKKKDATKNDIERRIRISTRRHTNKNKVEIAIVC